MLTTGDLLKQKAEEEARAAKEREELERLAEPLLKSGYGDHLISILKYGA